MKDDKDWTWVLERPCADCGFDPAALPRDRLADAFRANIAEWPSVLARADVRVRPSADVWSPLEYSAHVRDVFVTMSGRLNLMLTQDDPLFPNWDQDATAESERYAEQEPAEVAARLTADGLAYAAAIEAVTAWDRPGRRSDGAAFTVESITRYALHDPTHHLWDVTGSPITGSPLERSPSEV